MGKRTKGVYCWETGVNFTVMCRECSTDMIIISDLKKADDTFECPKCKKVIEIYIEED